MDLFFRKLGQGDPLIILHGLFGMSDNWLTIGKKLSNYFEVYLLDLRNHGNSPHSNEFNYQVMSQDVVNFIENLSLEKPLLLGHSMGGKVGMTLALEFPQLIHGLIVVDIAPRVYFNTRFKAFLEILLRLDLTQFKTRSEIDRHIAQKIPQIAIRQFLLKNLKRTSDNHFSWKLNLKAIYENLEHILSAVKSTHHFDGPVLFLRGEKSDYIQQSDIPEIKKLFPEAQIKTIAGASHWVHADAPDLLIAEIVNFWQTNRRKL